MFELSKHINKRFVTHCNIGYKMHKNQKLPKGLTVITCNYLDQWFSIGVSQKFYRVLDTTIFQYRYNMALI